MILKLRRGDEYSAVVYCKAESANWTCTLLISKFQVTKSLPVILKFVTSKTYDTNYCLRRKR